MILSLEDAKKIDPNITQSALDAFEAAVRQLTNNNFQNRRVRYKGLRFIDPDQLEFQELLIGLRAGDTIQVSNSTYNDGLYTIKDITSNTITVEAAKFYGYHTSEGFITKVEYPADIRAGIEKLIAYDKKMGAKQGIKSETISRMSVTYYDVNSTESVDGYPASLMNFLDKYNKMRW